MFVRDLINCGKETKHRLKTLRESEVHNNDEIKQLERKMEVLDMIQRYILSGNWTRKASHEKYIALIKSKFDYKLIAERFNTTRASLDVFAARQDKRLRGTVGEALQLIEQDRIDEGLDCFYAATGEFIDNELNYIKLELLPKTVKKDSFLVSDCVKEIEILRSLLMTNVRRRLNDADSDKLSYLVSLLYTKDSTFNKQRRELIVKLRKKDSQ